MASLDRRPEWRPRRTMIDLYIEKNGTRWYYKFGATLSAIMLAVGYVIFPFTFIRSYDSTVTHAYSVTSAFVLLVLACTSSAIISILTQSWLFRLEALYIPHLCSSIVGLTSIVYALATHNGVFGDPSSAHFAIAGLVLSLAFTSFYAALSVIVYRKVYIVRKRDALHHFAAQNKGTEYTPEDDEQRRQLSRLLLKQDESKAERSISATQTTFKIEWPGCNTSQSRQTSMSTPSIVPSIANVRRFGSRRASVRVSPDSRPTIHPEHLPSTVLEEQSQPLPQISTSLRNWMCDPSINRHIRGVDRDPAMVQEESTGSSQNASFAQVPPSLSGRFGDQGPTPLRPVAYIPPSQDARYIDLESPTTQPATPQSALPSYTAHAHPSLNLSIRPLPSCHGNKESSFPTEKKEPAIYAVPTSIQRRPAQEGPYRMADPEMTDNLLRNANIHNRRLRTSREQDLARA